MRQRLSLASALLAALAAPLSGCQGPAATPACITDELGAQPAARFPSGRTYYLPTLTADPACASLAWALESAPSESANEVMTQAGQARFTPEVPGTYRFALGGGGETRTLEVIDGTTVPYEDFAYYPARSQAEVGDEVQGVVAFSPQLSTYRGAIGVYISDLWVAEAARGQGLGRRLLAAVRDEAAGLWGPGYLRLTVYAHNPDARRLYDRLGFTDRAAEVWMVLDGQALEVL